MLPGGLEGGEIINTDFFDMLNRWFEVFLELMMLVSRPVRCSWLFV